MKLSLVGSGYSDSELSWYLPHESGLIFGQLIHKEELLENCFRIR